MKPPKVPLRLLLIEDSEDDAELVVQAIKCGGYDISFERVETAETMERALAKGGWDIVVSDFRMPKFDALEALSVMKKKSVDLPFLVVSGTIGEEVAVETMRRGAQDYIMKDKLARLVPAIERELREAKYHKKLRESEDQLRQAQKMEAVGRLAGGVAHDHNNVLAVILMYCDMIMSRLPSSDPNYDDVDQIKKSAERAASLTRQLLAFSRKQIIEPKILDLNVIVSDFAKMIQRLVGERIRLILDLKSELGRVRIDPGQLHQVLMNLTVNSRDAMPSGGTLTINTHTVVLEEPSMSAAEIPVGSYIVLSVTDTGCGMDGTTKARIFEPFFTTKGPNIGTGLGLSTVYGVVKQNGGHITVQSEPGEGATFRVYFQRLDLPDEPQAEPPRAPASERKDAGKILYVEDDEDLRGVVTRVLESKGFEVLKPQNGKEALALVEQHAKEIDILVTDVVMPGVDGPQIAQKLFELNPEAKILYISGYYDIELNKSEEIKKQSYFLQKPFSVDTFIRKVRNVLNNERYESDARQSEPNA